MKTDKATRREARQRVKNARTQTADGTIRRDLPRLGGGESGKAGNTLEEALYICSTNERTWSAHRERFVNDDAAQHTERALRSG